MSFAHPQSHVQRTPLQRLFVWRWSNLNQIVFLFLSATCILNVNAIMIMLFGVQRSASVLILAFSVICIFTANVKPGKALGRAGVAFFVFMGYFLVLALPQSFDQRNMFMIFQLYIGTIIVVLGASLAGWRIAQKEDLYPFLMVFYGIWIVAVLSIFFSDQIREVATNISFSDNRDSGFFVNPNQAGYVASIAFGIGFALLGSGKRSFWVVLGMVIAAVGALRTFSKMGILAIVIVILFQLFQTSNTKKGRIRIVLISVLGACAVYWLLTVGLYWLDLHGSQLHRLEEVRDIVLKQEINDETTTSRTFLFKVGVEKFLNSPLFGQGLGSFRRMKEAMGFGTHNTYLMIAGEGGIFALLLMFAFQVRWGFAALTCKDPVLRQFSLNYILIFSIECVSSHSMLNHRFQNIMIGLTIGLLAGRASYHTRKTKEAQRRAVDAAAVDAAILPGPQPLPA